MNEKMVRSSGPQRVSLLFVSGCLSAALTLPVVFPLWAEENPRNDFSSPEAQAALQSLSALLEQLEAHPEQAAKLLSQLSQESEKVRTDLTSVEKEIQFLKQQLQLLERGAQVPDSSSPRENIDFKTQVFAIFERSCFECHGPQKQKAELRLDAKAVVFKGGHSGPAVTPGKAEESLLFRRVAGIGDDQRMPPKGPPLAGDEISLIRDWINQGADWPEGIGSGATKVVKHWSYEKVVRPPLPETRNKNWARNPIDAFILARLEKEGLEPSPEASKEKLIRRASLDLTGLPPTIEEIDAFLVDNSPDSYEKIVDRLLASPHYGERQAQFWLDLARYADSNGYHIDTDRSMWPYRDWVIDAFNRDLPFDRFTIEQLAGDMLPGADQSQNIASGFNRNTMFNEEGGIDPEEFRTKAVVDRVNTTATVWLGSTLACAQCHDHKFDPFTQEDFYRFYSFFNNVPELGGGTRATKAPLVYLFTDQQKAELEKIHSGSAETRHKLDTPTDDLATEQKAWELRMSEGIAWKTLVPKCYTAESRAVLRLLPDGSLLASGPRPTTDEYTVEAETGLTGITAIRLEILPDESLPGGGIGRHEQGTPALSAIQLRAGSAGIPEAATKTVLQHPTADTEKGSGEIERVVDERSGAGWVLDGTAPQGHYAVFELKKPIRSDTGAKLEVLLKQRSGLQSTFGRFRLSATDTPLPVRILPKSVQDILALSGKGSRTEDQETQLAAHYRTISPSLDAERTRLDELSDAEEKLLKSATSTLVMEEMPKPREAHIHIRGDFLSPGKAVTPGVPAVFTPLPKGEPANRLTLAKWLVDPDNPLVARVTMNRLWEQFFGRGLVETSEDFGSQGTPPTHPELLDWLATEFVGQGWSMKSIQRLMVTSATYRQDTRVDSKLLEKDPYNRLFARGPRFRLDAEAIRDNALAAAGLLNPKIGGSSVFPPQPAGLWAALGSKGYGNEEWTSSTGERRYRRGLYTYWRRSIPYPSFVTFDAPARESCIVKRPRTNTPLQALVTLNDPAFVEAALGLAERILLQSGTTDPGERAAFAFRVCLSRQPRTPEKERLVNLCVQQFEHFKQHPEAVEAMVKQASSDKIKGLDPAELAAWGVVANVLLNLDETLTKG